MAAVAARFPGKASHGRETVLALAPRLLANVPAWRAP